jgi:hypothetical protein
MDGGLPVVGMIHLGICKQVSAFAISLLRGLLKNGF